MVRADLHVTPGKEQRIGILTFSSMTSVLHALSPPRRLNAPLVSPCHTINAIPVGISIVSQLYVFVTQDRLCVSYCIIASETGIVHYECQWYLLHLYPPGTSSVVTIVAPSILQTPLLTLYQPYVKVASEAEKHAYGLMEEVGIYINDAHIRHWLVKG